MKEFEDEKMNENEEIHEITEDDIEIVELSEDDESDVEGGGGSGGAWKGYRQITVYYNGSWDKLCKDNYVTIGGNRYNNGDNYNGWEVSWNDKCMNVKMHGNRRSVFPRPPVEIILWHRNEFDMQYRKFYRGRWT